MTQRKAEGSPAAQQVRGVPAVTPQPLGSSHPSSVSSPPPGRGLLDKVPTKSVQDGKDRRVLSVE